MSITLDGTAGVVVSGNTNTLSGITVGRGAGSVATNTAVGASALAANTSGAGNSAFGDSALVVNTTGSYNAAIGRQSLSGNTTGSSNTAVGQSALLSNTTASNNTAVGYQAGYTNATGTESTFLGYKAGAVCTANYNTFIGANAGLLATSGVTNTFVGAYSGQSITTGSKNTIIGNFSGNSGGLNITTASNYIVLSDGDGNPRFYINQDGRPFLGGLGSDAGTNTVKFNTGTGRLSYDTSSARYKDNIRDSVYGLSHVMQMRSTQFEYKEGGRSDVGLIAEELDLIVPELVGKNDEGQPDSVSYDRMVSVLVKAIQELKAEFDAYKATHP